MTPLTANLFPPFIDILNIIFDNSISSNSDETWRLDAGKPARKTNGPARPAASPPPHAFPSNLLNPTPETILSGGTPHVKKYILDHWPLLRFP